MQSFWGLIYLCYTNYDSEILDALVKIGVTLVDTAMVGEIGPQYRRFPAPIADVPTPKNASVSPPPVACGNVMLATGVTVFATTPHPDVPVFR